MMGLFLQLTVAALTNGLNPCGIGMMITFLGYLLVFGKGGKEGRKRALKMGIVYILGVFVTYLLLGIVFYSLAFYLQRLWIARVFKTLMGVLIMLAGAIQIKDTFFPNLPIHLRMPEKGSKLIGSMMEKMNLPMAGLVGIATTAFSTPCMLPLYVGTAAYLAGSGMNPISVLGAFLYYNLVFILPLLLILVVVVGGREIVEMKELEHRYGKWGRMLMAILMLVVGYMIVFK